MTNSSNTLTTTKVRAWIRAFVASAAGSIAAYLAVHFGKLDTGTFAFIGPAAAGVYYAAVAWAEKHFPSLGWLLGALPQPKSAAGSKAVK